VSQWLETFTGLPKISSDHIYSWVLILPSLLILDFGNYLCHYFLHRFDFLWEFHKIHHSSPTLDWLATFRSHVLEQLLRRFLSPVLLILFGFPVNSVLTAWTILLGWAIFNHSNLHLDLQFMEWIFITPRLHRVHHLPDQSERNLGTVFTFWDQIRGTLAKIPTNDQSRFGNGDSNYPQSWGPQFIEPLKDLSFTKSVLKLYDQIV
jgi:sterol desaturase/sphingolipid hydroxylase (fatty acid hydroxylase superfamily)